MFFKFLQVERCIERPSSSLMVDQWLCFRFLQVERDTEIDSGTMKRVIVFLVVIRLKSTERGSNVTEMVVVVLLVNVG